MRRRVLKAIGLLALVSCGSAGVHSLIHRADGPEELVVVVHGVRSDEGRIFVSLFDASGGFPADPDRAFRKVRTAAVAPETEVRFPEVPEGTYALAVLHDENDSGEAETDWLGRPTEGWGVSNDARGRFGPPSFEDASVVIEPGQTALRIRVRY